MSLDLTLIRNLILEAKNDILDISKELKELRKDIKEEINEIQELREKVTGKKSNFYIEDPFENETDYIIKFEKEENVLREVKYSFSFLFHCDKCPNKFILKTGLKKYKWTHPEIIVYSCDICQKSFLCKGDLEDHDSKVLKDVEIEGKIFLIKNDQNFIFEFF